MQPDEIYLASFPFGDVPGMKLRPVLLLTGTLGSVPEVLVAYISSVLPVTLLATDVLVDPALAQNTSTNLKSKSVVRLHKLATVHAQSVVRRLGAIPPAMQLEVDQKLRIMLGL